MRSTKLQADCQYFIKLLLDSSFKLFQSKIEIIKISQNNHYLLRKLTNTSLQTIIISNRQFLIQILYYKSGKQMNSDLEKQLKNLFNSLRMNKDQNSPVQRNSLITLFQYHSMDIQMPQFYRYLCRSLQKLPDQNVREEDFLKIVMNPDIDLTLASKQEMADAFSILDIDKEGSIDMNKFLQMYESSQNFQLLSAAQKKDIIDQIKQAFFSVSEDKRITPLDFYQIVKFRNS